jgi:tRNA pseudouridine55 synthase
MHGFIVVDKPAGMTSHDVVARVRRLLKIKKVGHTGTLDPFATGVLPVAVGEATKAIPFLDESEKEYRAVIRLGVVTDTDDLDGTIIAECPVVGIGEADIRTVLAGFIGTLAQIPPLYSALKRNGVPLYRLARRGEEVEREARQVTIHALTVDRIDLPDVAITVRCSRGTYIRALARDVGERLACGAHLTELRRTASGSFTLEHARTLEQLAGEAATGAGTVSMVTIGDALSHLGTAMLTEEGERKVRCGMAPDAGDCEGGFPVGSPGGKLCLVRNGAVTAVAELPPDPNGGKLRLLRGFN